MGLGHIGCTIGRHIHSLGLIFVFGQVFLRAGIGNHYLWAYSNISLTDKVLIGVHALVSEVHWISIS